MGLFFNYPLHSAAHPIKEPPDAFVGGGEWTGEGGRDSEGVSFGLPTPPPTAVLSVQPATLHI